MPNLDGSVCIVTGAGRGIGRETALHLARAGAAVALIARTSTEISETETLIRAEGGKAVAVAVDLVDRVAVEKAVQKIIETLGPVDLLVNNHGSFRAFGPIWECDPDVWWQDVEINLRGSFHTSRCLAPEMLARGRGRIVNFVDGGTGNSFPHGSGYASSKAAIMRFTECFNDTTKEGGVLAFAVDPGLVRTPMTELQVSSEDGKKYLSAIQTLFEEGVDLPPSRAATLIVEIATGRFDALAGRMLKGADDRDQLENEMAALVEEDGRALRFTKLFADA